MARQVEVCVVLEGEADPAEHLDARLGDLHRAVEADGRRDVRGEPGLVGIVLERHHGVPRGCRHRLAGLEHLGAQVLDRLEGADPLAELLTHLRVVDGGVQAPARDTGRLGRGEAHEQLLGALDGGCGQAVQGDLRQAHLAGRAGEVDRRARHDRRRVQAPDQLPVVDWQ